MDPPARGFAEPGVASVWEDGLERRAIGLGMAARTISSFDRHLWHALRAATWYEVPLRTARRGSLSRYAARSSERDGSFAERSRSDGEVARALRSRSHGSRRQTSPVNLLCQEIHSILRWGRYWKSAGPDLTQDQRRHCRGDLQIGERQNQATARLILAHLRQLYAGHRGGCTIFACSHV